jgi:preprotein translocase subunit YajC
LPTVARLLYVIFLPPGHSSILQRRPDETRSRKKRKSPEGLSRGVTRYNVLPVRGLLLLQQNRERRQKQQGQRSEARVATAATAVTTSGGRGRVGQLADSNLELHLAGLVAEVVVAAVGDLVLVNAASAKSLAVGSARASHVPSVFIAITELEEG